METCIYVCTYRFYFVEPDRIYRGCIELAITCSRSENAHEKNCAHKMYELH